MIVKKHSIAHLALGSEWKPFKADKDTCWKLFNILNVDVFSGGIMPPLHISVRPLGDVSGTTFHTGDGLSIIDIDFLQPSFYYLACIMAHEMVHCYQHQNGFVTDAIATSHKFLFWDFKKAFKDNGLLLETAYNHKDVKKDWARLRKRLTVIA